MLARQQRKGQCYRCVAHIYGNEAVFVFLALEQSMLCFISHTFPIVCHHFKHSNLFNKMD